MNSIFITHTIELFPTIPIPSKIPKQPENELPPTVRQRNHRQHVVDIHKETYITPLSISNASGGRWSDGAT